MIETRTVERTLIEEEPVAVICNKCGRREPYADAAEAYNGVVNDFYRFVVGGGYDSTFPGDLNEVCFHLCGPCLQAFTETFTVPCGDNP